MNRVPGTGLPWWSCTRYPTKSQPSVRQIGLITVTIAELSLPMLSAAAPERAADPDATRWVGLARSGDRAAFGRLIEAHLPAARRLALAAVGQVSDADEAVQEAAIAQVVRALPRKLRDPFLMAASGDHRYEDIALLLGTPVGTVKWRVSEARRLVRTKLHRLGHGDPR